MGETATGGRVAIGASWAVALIGSVAVIAGAAAGAQWATDDSALGRFGALGVVFAAAVLTALVAQLATRRPAGFVARASWSVGGAAAVAVAAALVLAVVGG
ncbi:hypothetical protein GE115_14365 [Agromyces sp. CFH 90414]|uniref:Uncharacterized protein n=1 Tax=Agromyces agglutinans TaxID=2662258 RepID=A0A6I2F8T4_9MICO|nr:hypothetical protein [Agromyces agglutinans]MRG61039.1 hypothetical protein [Agromyces agglutinans]